MKAVWYMGWAAVGYALVVSASASEIDPESWVDTITGRWTNRGCVTLVGTRPPDGQHMVGFRLMDGKTGAPFDENWRRRDLARTYHVKRNVVNAICGVMNGAATVEELLSERMIQELTLIYRQAGIRWDQLRGVVNGVIVCTRSSVFDAVTQPLLEAVGRKTIQETREERLRVLEEKRHGMSRVAQPIARCTRGTKTSTPTQKQQHRAKPTKAGE